MIAKSDAAGGPSLLPEVLAFSSSLEQDRALLREDLVGSMAHLAMLSRQGIVPAEAARAIHDGLVGLWRDAESGTFVPVGEEDVHMAIEGELASGTLGAASVRGLKPARQIYVVRASGRITTRAAEAFLEFARAHAA